MPAQASSAARIVDAIAAAPAILRGFVRGECAVWKRRVKVGARSRSASRNRWDMQPRFVVSPDTGRQKPQLARGHDVLVAAYLRRRANLLGLLLISP
jgi:hypothetical protein